MTQDDVRVKQKWSRTEAPVNEDDIRTVPPWIVLLGVDGVGKSSILDLIKLNSFTPYRGIRIFHRRPGVVYAKPEEDSGVILHYAKPPHNPVKSSLKLLVMVLDWIFGYWLHIRKWRSEGYLVISDRHSLLDMLVDPLRYRYGGPHRLVELVLPLTPQPDLVLVLDAPEDVLEARKSELTKQQIKELREGYLQMSRSLPNFRVIDAARSIEEVYADVIAAIQAL